VLKRPVDDHYDVVRQVREDVDCDWPLAPSGNGRQDENGMTPYRHTQVGTLVIIPVGIAVIVLIAAIVRGGAHPIAVAVAVVLLLCISMFHSLTVEVTDKAIRVRFGMGPFGKSFAPSAIQQAKAVRNPWYYGWGIRWFPRGWLFNVSGLDAVELVMRDRRVYRIGTDQPEELLIAIERARGKEPGVGSKKVR
jgi:hypothetical protein